MKTIALGLVVAVAVLAGVMFLRGQAEPETRTAPARQEQWKEPRDAMPAPSSSADLVLGIRPGTRRMGAAAASKMSPLMREATSGGPWKPIYDRLSQSTARTPEESYVLAEILRVCGDAAATLSFPRADMREEAKASFAASISEKDPAREKRVAAWTRMTESRCIGFEGLKTSAGEIRALLDKAAAGGDAKARARVVEKDIWASVVGPGGTMQRTEMSAPSITDAQLATLREAAASNDPQALMIAGRVLSSTMSDLSIRAGPQERPVDPRAFYDAWNLAACDAGYDCGPGNQQMLMACSAQGNCDAQDLREYLFYYNNSPQQSQLVAEYQSQIARAIQTGDWAYFQFVRARPPAGMVYGFGQP